MIVAVDTHALLWWTLEPAKLGAKARAALDGAERIGVPAIVFWEVALLARLGKITLGSSTADWLRDVRSIARIEPLPLTPEIAVAADALVMHPDPADRFIVATAIQQQLSLVTKDKAIQSAKVVATIW